MPRVILGTRGSALALWQARHVAGLLREQWPDLDIVERIIRTEGDIQQTQPLGPGSVGVFVRRLEVALSDGEIDFAVHSLKDMPTEQPEGLVVTAVPLRHDPRDVLLTREGRSFEELPSGTRIGTGSFRRRTQLLHARPDLETLPIRGNIDTRIGKVAVGELEAIVLALAGVERLGIDRVPYRPIDVDRCLPAVAQGALGLETRADDARTREIVGRLDHEDSHRAVAAERAFLRRLGGGCLAPATAFGTVEQGGLWLRAAVGDADGGKLLRDEIRGPVEAAAALGEQLADRMIGVGARDLLTAARAASRPDGNG